MGNTILGNRCPRGVHRLVPSYDRSLRYSIVIYRRPLWKSLHRPKFSNPTSDWPETRETERSHEKNAIGTPTALGEGFQQCKNDAFLKPIIFFLRSFPYRLPLLKCKIYRRRRRRFFFGCGITFYRHWQISVEPHRTGKIWAGASYNGTNVWTSRGHHVFLEFPKNVIPGSKKFFTPDKKCFRFSKKTF